MRKPHLALALVTGAVTLAGASLALPAHADGGSSASPTPSPTASPQPDPTPSAAHPTATSTSAGAPSGRVIDTTTTPVEVTSTIEPVCPDYGTTKIRVGVQIADGSYVPPDTTTFGSALTITDTAPDCERPDAVHGEAKTGPHGATSRTLTVHVDEAGSTSCTTSQNETPSARGAHAAGSTGSATETDCEATSDTDAGHFDNGYYYPAQDGDTVTIRQVSVPAGQAIVKDPNSQTIAPCVEEDLRAPAATGSRGDATCSGNAENGDTEVDAIFNDRGLPPAAAHDAATVETGDSADILVLNNDDSAGAPTTITHVGTPSHGTATVEGTGSYTPVASYARSAHAVDDSQTVLYTPRAGFVGTDSFPYTITDANGTATAAVTVTVTGPPPVADDDTATTTVGGAVTIHVTSNDSANGGGKLTVTSVGDPAHGTAKIDGDTIVYTPDAGFTGRDTFPYTIETAYGTASAVVTVTIDPAAVPVPTTPTGGTLPFTGLDASLLGVTATGLLLGGAGARVLARRRPLTRRQRRASHRGRH